MKRLLLALASVFVVHSAAYAATFTYGFYQGGYDDNAFVAGYFVTRYNSGIIGYVNSQEGNDCISNQEGCGLVDYFMHFSGNSLVQSFEHHGLSSFSLWTGADFDNTLGILYDTRSSTIPVGDLLPVGCSDSDCTSRPFGFMASQNWSYISNPDLDGPGIDRGFQWVGGPSQSVPWCSDQVEICGSVTDDKVGSPTRGGFTITTERIRVFAIAEPHPLTLIGLALVGLAIIRRRER